jgi:hypothetical protein
MSDIEFYGIGDQESLIHQDFDECVEDYLDQCDRLDIAFDVQGYKTCTIATRFLQPLEHVLELLDEEYGDPEGGYTKPTEKMKEAEESFLEAVLSEYKAWTCEPIGEPVKVNGFKWARKHRPDWIREHEARIRALEEA